MPVKNPSNLKHFPKILFVNEYGPDSQVLSDLIRQLLLGYPVEKIAWWHSRRTPTYENPDLKVGQVDCFPMPAKLVPNKKWTGAKSFLLEHTWVPLAARHLCQTVARTKPDVVWILMNAWPGITATAANFRNVRLHASVWDFHEMNSRKDALGGAARARRFTERTFQFVKRADTYDSLCPGSLEEIRLHTGRNDGVIVHSGFEPAHLQALETGSAGTAADDGVLRIAYAGTIISEKGFFKTLAALDKVRASQSRKVVLEFFGARNYKKCPWFNPEWMIEHGLFTDEGLIQAVRRCTWGIVVMDPEAEDLQYSRFSFPNKVGTYLSAGVPVLGFGNPQSCLVLMMQGQNFGRFTTATDAASLEKFFTESFQIQSPREVFRQGILDCARTEFNAEEMRSRLWKLWGVQ